MAEIKIRMTESYLTYIVRDSIVIDTQNYPELDGMNEEDIKDYIKANAYDMKSPEGWDYCDNLYDALMEQDIIRDKISNEEEEVEFD